jgi:hypothetical protein
MIEFLIYVTCPFVGYFVNQFLGGQTDSVLYRAFLACFIAYLPTYVVTNHLSMHGGYPVEWIRKFRGFKLFKGFVFKNASITLEVKLDHSKAYLFCNFPHGTCSVNHLLTMTDCCEMISKHHTGERRDLAASVLFCIPILKEVCPHRFLLTPFVVC